jgi:lambda family phage tail tape measure protein
MATIQDFILRFKTEGDSKLKGVANTVKSLSDDVAGLGNQFGGLGNTLGGITGKLGPVGLAAGAAAGAFVALGLKATQLAGDLTDISNATGISAGSLLNFKQSLIEAGGSADSFSKFATKLNAAVGEANSGNEKFQKSFKDLGVNVRDANGELRPTETVLQDVLGSLKNIQDPAARAAAAVALLGKEAARIDWSNVSAGRDALTDKQIADLDRYNTLIDQVRAKLERRLITFFGSVAEQIIAATDAMDKFNKKQQELGKKGKTIYVDPRTGIANEVNMTPAQQKRFDAAMAAEAAQEQLNKTIEEGAADHAREMKRLTGGDQGARSEAGVKAAEESAKRAQLSILEAQKSAELKGLGEIGRIRKQAEYDILKEIENIRGQEKLTDAEKTTEIAAKRREIAARTELQVSDALEKQKKQLEGMSSEFEKQQALSRSKLDLETELVGKSAEEAQLIRAQRQLALDYVAAQEKLISQRDQLGRGEEQQAAKINQLIQSNADAYNRQAEELTKSINANQGALAIEKERASTVERIIAAYEQQQRLQQSIGDIQRNILDQERNVNFEGAQAGRSPAQRQIEQIRENARRAGREASKTFAAQFQDDGDGLSPENARRLAEGLALIETGYARIAEKQLTNLEASKTFGAGWKTAFEEYAENALNAASQAQTYFSTFTKGFEDAIVKFVQTGKLSFKDMANSIIADFARIQARQVLLGLFGQGGGTGGNILSTIFGGGRANGGSVFPGGAYMVGERGPEMMIPRTAGTIIPNEALGGSSNQTMVTYNIQAVDATSFRQMLARDPEFLYAVTEKGRSSMPGGRR